LGVGFGAGPILSGFVMASLGGAWTFLVFGGVTVIMVLFSILTQLMSQRLDKVKETQGTSKLQEYDTRNL